MVIQEESADVIHFGAILEDVLSALDKQEGSRVRARDGRRS